MRELRAVALSEDGGYLVLADAAGRADAEQFRVPVDDRLRAALRGARRSEVRTESALTPREIQARLRAGETAADVARAAGIPVERVERYEGPVLAERARVVQEARAALLPKDPGGVPGRPLGEVVDARLLSVQDDPQTAQWDAWRRVDGIWLVQLTSDSRCARWTWDPVVRRVRPHDDAARALVAPESADPTPAPPTAARPAGPALTLVHDQGAATHPSGQTGVSAGGFAQQTPGYPSAPAPAALGASYGSAAAEPGYAAEFDDHDPQGYGPPGHGVADHGARAYPDPEYAVAGGGPGGHGLPGAGDGARPFGDDTGADLGAAEFGPDEDDDEPTHLDGYGQPSPVRPAAVARRPAAPPRTVPGARSTNPGVAAARYGAGRRAVPPPSRLGGRDRLAASPGRGGADPAADPLDPAGRTGPSSPTGPTGPVAAVRRAGVPSRVRTTPPGQLPPGESDGSRPGVSPEPTPGAESASMLDGPDPTTSAAAEVAVDGPNGSTGSLIPEHADGGRHVAHSGAHDHSGGRPAADDAAPTPDEALTDRDPADAPFTAAPFRDVTATEMPDGAEAEWAASSALDPALAPASEPATEPASEPAAEPAPAAAGRERSPATDPEHAARRPAAVAAARQPAASRTTASRPAAARTAAARTAAAAGGEVAGAGTPTGRGAAAAARRAAVARAADGAAAQDRAEPARSGQDGRAAEQPERSAEAAGSASGDAETTAGPGDGARPTADAAAGAPRSDESATDSGEKTPRTNQAATQANRGRQSGTGRGGERSAGGRRGRKSVPAWDDIVFGARRP